MYTHRWTERPVSQSPPMFTTFTLAEIIRLSEIGLLRLAIRL